MTHSPLTMTPIEVPERWDALFEPPARKALERALALHVETQRWYRSKTSRVLSARVVQAFRLPKGVARARIVLVEITRDDRVVDTYVVPLALVVENEARRFAETRPGGVVVPVDVRHEGDLRRGLLVDAAAVPAFLDELWDALARAVTVADGGATLRFHRLTDLPAAPPGPSSALDREQTNTSLRYGDRYVGKIVRKLDGGPSPAVELGRFLTETGFGSAPALAGWVEVDFATSEGGDGEPSAVFLFHELVSNHGDAWSHALAAVGRFLDDGSRATSHAPASGDRDLYRRADEGPQTDALIALGPYAEHARVLGTRVGAMHRTLASRTADPAFAPEPFDAAARVTASRRARANLSRVVRKLRDTSTDVAALAKRATSCEEALDGRLESFASLADSGVLMRVHGDLHLGQVLFTGEDFAIIDFDGEPARSLQERREKRSPLVDVAGMVRSYHYAVQSALRAQPSHANAEEWAALFYEVASAMFLRGWLSEVDGLVPARGDSRRALLEFFLLEKCLYEIEYEMENRPDWLTIPLEGLLSLAGDAVS